MSQFQYSALKLIQSQQGRTSFPPGGISIQLPQMDLIEAIDAVQREWIEIKADEYPHHVGHLVCGIALDLGVKATKAIIQDLDSLDVGTIKLSCKCYLKDLGNCSTDWLDHIDLIAGQTESLQSADESAPSRNLIGQEGGESGQEIESKEEKM